MKKILVHIDDDGVVEALCDMTNAKTKSDYITCLRTAFEPDDFEIDDDDGTERLIDIELNELVSELKSDGNAEFGSDGQLQIIDLSKVPDPFAKAKKKTAKKAAKH